MNRITPETLHEMISITLNPSRDPIPFHSNERDAQLIIILAHKINEYFFKESMKDVVNE